MNAMPTEPLRLFIPIRKVDESARTVYGVATAEVPDKSREIFDYSTSKPYYEEWSKSIAETTGGKSLGNVREMHSNIAAGKLTDIYFDDDKKQIEVCAKVIDDGTWNKVLEGVLTGFSHGGSYVSKWKDPENPRLIRYTAQPQELSLVDNPCVPVATFEVIKADGTTELRKFIHTTQEDSMTATEDAGGAAATDNVTKAEAANDTQPLTKVEAVKDGKPVKPKAAPMQKWLAEDGLAFDTKREAEVHNLELEKTEELAPSLVKMEELLKHADLPEKEDAPPPAQQPEAQPEVQPEPEPAPLEKKDYSAKEREKMAEEGTAMEDGSFPIANKKDLENAIHAYGRAKDKDAAKKHIIARAKALDAEDLLPDDWKPTKEDKKSEKAAPVSLMKGLPEVARAAYLIQELEWFQQCLEAEAQWERDNSPQPAELKKIIGDLCAFLKALVDEETSELFDDDDDVEVEILEMAAKMSGASCDTLAKFISANDVKAALAKAGARHSASDKDSLLAIHKSAADHVDMVQKCLKAAGVMDDAETDDKATQKMSKVVEALNAKTDEVLAVTKVATATNESLLKAIPLIESLQKKNEELVMRIDHLERQPAAPKGNVRAISKAQDNGHTGDGKSLSEQFEAELSKMTPQERSTQLMKLSLRNPLTAIR